MLAYRLLVDNQQQTQQIWLQTSARVVYRSNKPESILCIHRRLTDDEGEALISKRASEFRLPCALFDAVDAASVTSLQRNADEGDVVHDRAQQFSECSTAKKAKTVKRSRASAFKKCTEAAPIAHPANTSTVLLPNQTPDWSAFSRNYVANPYYSTSSSFADQFGGSFPNLTASNPTGSFMGSEYQPDPLQLAYYSSCAQYNQQYEDPQNPSSSIVNNLPCIYNGIVNWSANRQSTFAYTPQPTGAYDASSPSQSGGGAVSDESPQTGSTSSGDHGFTSVIRHTNFQTSPYQYDQYLTQLGNANSTTTAPGMFYAGTPATQFLS